MAIIERAARYSADDSRAIAVGERMNGYQVRATCLVSRAGLDEHVVILGVQTTHTNATEYVVAPMSVGASEWWQGHYTRDVGIAVATFLRLTSLGDLLPEQSDQP